MTYSQAERINEERIATYVLHKSTSQTSQRRQRAQRLNGSPITLPIKTAPSMLAGKHVSGRIDPDYVALAV
jgi:hypothetical protein